MTERVLRGSQYLSRVQVGREFEDTLKRILIKKGWDVLPTDGRPTDVLAKLNNYTLMIEAKDLEGTNLQAKDNKIIQWKYKKPYPFRLKPFFKARERNKPNLAMVVTTATINNRERNYIIDMNDIPVMVMNYRYFRGHFIDAHTDRILKGTVGRSTKTVEQPIPMYAKPQ